RPFGVDAGRLMSGVGGSGGIAPCYRSGKPPQAIRDRSREPPVPDALKLVIPPARWQPDFEPDVRVIRWLDNAGHATKRRKIADRLLTGRREGPGNRLCGGD